MAYNRAKTEAKFNHAVCVAAKSLLWDGTPGPAFEGCTEFICIAIARAGKENQSLRLAVDRVTEVIDSRLAPHTTVQSWLKEQGHLNLTHSKKDVQEYRHRWLDALAEEFLAKSL